MTSAQFFVLLGIITALTAVMIYFLSGSLAIEYALGFNLGIAALLAVVNVVVFLLGKRTAGARNKLLFGNVFLGATMVKLFLIGAIIVSYILLGEPENKLFIVPFFLSYIIFTAYEVYFLMRLSAETRGVVDEPNKMQSITEKP